MYIGGNIGHIGIHGGREDFNARLAMLSPGETARFSVLFHEIFWLKDPNSWQFKEVVEMLTACKKAQVIPVVLVNCCFHPKSQWYQGTGYNDWWLVREDLWPQAMECAEAVLKVISKTAADLKLDYYLQIHNEPSKGKPGGTNKYITNGAWHEAHHRFWFQYCQVIAKYVKKSRIIGPARSCFLEDSMTCLSEMATFIPPKAYDWRKFCGIPHVRHLRFGASWAKGDLKVFEAGVREKLAVFLGSQQFVGNFAVTELYVTSGDVGKPIGADNTQEKLIVLKMLREVPKLKFVCCWGLKDVEFDAGQENNPWFSYGQWGKTLPLYRELFKGTPAPPAPPVVLPPVTKSPSIELTPEKVDSPE